MPDPHDNECVLVHVDSVAQNVGLFTERDIELAVLGVVFHFHAKIRAFQKHLDAFVNRKHRFLCGKWNPGFFHQEIEEPIDIV